MNTIVVSENANKKMDRQDALDAVTYPECLDLHGRAVVSLTKLARAVADDDRPGDDGVGPRELLVGALDVVRVPRLHLHVCRAGGSLVLTPEIAYALVHDTNDDFLMTLGSMAWADAMPSAGLICSSRAALCAEHAALVLVVDVLLHLRADATRRAEVQRSVLHERVEAGASVST